MPTDSPRTHYWVSFVVLAVSVGSFALMQSMTVPVISEIQLQLDTDRSTATWVLTAYLLSASVFTPIIGRLGDAFGKKRMMVLSLAMLSLGSLVAALAPNVGVMIAARVLQGVGGGTFPLAFGIIRDEFPSHKTSLGVSVVSSLSAVGFAAGILCGGPIVEHLGYHWLFWLPMIVTGGVAVVAAVVVPESPVRAPGRIPVMPAVLLSAWLVCLLLALSQGNAWGWLSARTLGLVALAGLFAWLWIRLELHVPVPLVDMRMMRLKPVWTTNLVALLVGVVMYASFGFLPQFVQAPDGSGYGFGATVTESGLMMLPTAIASFVAGLLVAPLMRVLGPKTLIVASSLVSAAGMASIAMFHEDGWQLLVGVGVNGLGIGLIFSSLGGLIVAAVSPEQTGVATGMNANIRTIGGAVGTAIMGSLVTAQLLADGTPAEHGFIAGFWILAGVMVVTAAAALLIPTVSAERIEAEIERAPLNVAQPEPVRG